VPADARQHVRLPGVVLHELARQLDRIPGNTVDAGDARVVDPRQQVVQAVPELMEECHDVIVCQERRALPARRQEIAHQVGHRQGIPRGQALAPDALVHPRAAALARARIGIEVEAADGRPRGTADVEETHILVPQRHAGSLADAHLEEPLGDFEQSGEHPWQRKIGPQLFLRDIEALALQPLGVEAYVPCVEPGAGKGLQLRELAARRIAGAAGELREKAEHLIDAVGHAGGERVGGVVREVEQLRGLVPAPQNVLHHRGVVPAPGAGSLVGGAR
jgi:hypothetical protein